MITPPPSDPYQIYPYHWPVINPGNSWAVPRIAMPQFFSIQWDYAIDSWYYIGHGIDDAGDSYSFNLIVGRRALRGRNPVPQMAYLALGVGSHAAQKFYASFGYGLDVSDDPTHPAALILPPVTDFSFDILFTPLPPFSDTKARIRYTGGAPVGIAGATYRIDCAGTSKGGDALSLGLDLKDERGTMLEGASGCVEPPNETDKGVFTYEVAQPRLTITGGTLAIGARKVNLVGGSLWHDRQAYTLSPYGGGFLPGAGTTEDMVTQASKEVATLYRGMWIALTLDSGISMLVTPQWAPVTDWIKDPIKAKGQQWVSGRAVKRPPTGGYGNLFLPPNADRYNGGALLSGGSASDNDWDFDVNIFDPQNPQDSPHWQSPDYDNNVYGTKWAITFSDRLGHWGVPKEIFVVALVDSCENTLAGSSPFWEGAARLYSDRACTQPIGYGFVEQMGYN
jgi:hypothetical protein